MEVHLRVTRGPHSGEECLCADRSEVVVGRSSTVQFSMHLDKKLSREHFTVKIDPPNCVLKDLGSTNGTRVNGLRVETTRLLDGDVVSAGESEFEVSVEESTFDGRRRFRCLNCGRVAADGAARAVAWLCDDCLEKRRIHPQTHPDFLIEKALGSGGMGKVYLARQLSNHRPVAIKMMVPTGAASMKAREYFFREMDVLRGLLMPSGQCHPNVVAFYDILEIDGQFQLIMEYVAGKNALDWVTDLAGDATSAPAHYVKHALRTNECSPIPPEMLPHLLSVSSAARIGRQLLLGLGYAHSKGYVHRDVKPSNVLVTGPPKRPQVKLSDFGLAKSFRENEGFADLTTKGVVGGSVGFISPDHLRDFGEAKEPADLYCAGVTLYYLLTLRYPYLGFKANYADARSMILEHPPIPLRVFRPDAPDGLDRVLRKALEKQPEDRWKSAGAMADALKPFIDAGTA